MRPFARIRAPDGRLVELAHGDIIGRLETAALCLDDARVSEAHAMVSLRGGALKLLALRGLFAVDDPTPRSEVVLTAGQRILLARDLALTVEAVSLPEEVLALEGEGLRRQILSGVASLRLRPHPELTSRYEERADAHVWSTGGGWRLQVSGFPPRALRAGDRFEVEGLKLHAVAVRLSEAGQAATQQRGRIDAPLKILNHFDTVHLQRPGRPPLVLTGISARIIAELALMGGPTPWEVVAGEIWRGEEDRDALRRSWDTSLSRLRSKLKAAGIRPDLISADGTGKLELRLNAGDEVEDHS